MASSPQRKKKTTPDKYIQIEEIADDNYSDDSDEECTTITTSELKAILHEELLKQEEKLKAHITDKFVELTAELTETKQIAQDAIMRAEANEQQIETLKSENIILKQQIAEIKSHDIRQLGEKIEDGTNRQLRNSVVFKGIEEE